MADELLTPDETAEYLGNTTKTLERWREKGEGPEFIRLGVRCVRYRRSAIDGWLAARTFKHRAHEATASVAA